MSTIAQTAAIQVGTTIGRKLVKIRWVDHKLIKAKHIFPVPNHIPLQHWLTGAATCVNNDNLLGQESCIIQACTPPKYIIPDTGCTGNYVPPFIEINNITEDSIRIRMHDAIHIQSKHCGDLPILQSPPNAATRIAHRIKQLTQLLLSISKLCDNDCVARFNKKIAT